MARTKKTTIRDPLTRDGKSVLQNIRLVTYEERLAKAAAAEAAALAAARYQRKVKRRKTPRMQVGGRPKQYVLTTPKPIKPTNKLDDDWMFEEIQKH
jgi:hypothetical protein